MRILLLALGLLILPGALFGQDVETKYLKLQESYSQRLLDLEQSYEDQQRELMNKFILALVRTEQAYRDQGDLEGVVMSRDLRESLLQNPDHLEANNEWPPRLREMFDELIRLRQENRAASQAKLMELNGVLLRALEAYKVEFTRQQNLEKALEIRDLQEALSRGLGLEPQGPASSGAVSPAPPPTGSVFQDPNAYAFLLEPPAYRDTQAISPRRAFQPAAPVIEGNLNENRLRYRFDGGNMSFDEAQLEPFRGLASRNQMFTLEFALSPAYDRLGTAGQPAVIFRWGPSVREANLALTQEGQRLYLYIKTSAPPEGRENYRIDLGLAEAQTPVHIMISFRGTDLAIYQDGTATQRLRGTFKGTFTNWAPGPLVFSKGSAERERRAERTGDEIAYGRWYGYFYLMSLKGSQETVRQLDENYRRFEEMMDL